MAILAGSMKLMVGRMRMRLGDETVYLPLSSTIQLQSYGRAPAVPASDLRVGNILLWNFGSTSELVRIEPLSQHYINIVERTERGEFTRKVKKSRLVALSPSRAHQAANPQLHDLVIDREPKPKKDTISLRGVHELVGQIADAVERGAVVPEPKPPLYCTPCCSHTWDPKSGIDEDRFGPIYWNASERVVKCHHCGTTFTPAS